MKKRISIFTAVAICLLTQNAAQGRDVTLTVGGAGISEVSIGTNETAQIVSWFPIGPSGTQLDITKDGLTLSFNSSAGLVSAGSTPVRIAGPATIRFLGVGSLNPPRGFCTVQIDPATFPPDKTVVVPADTGGANIILEASTNLIHWTTAAPGAYTNLQNHMFFRIRAERLP